MNLKFLKPDWKNIILTLIILLLPIFKERVQLEAGGFIVERYSPLIMMGSYAYLGDFYPLLLMLGFSLFIYVMSSIFIWLILYAKNVFSKACVK